VTHGVAPALRAVLAAALLLGAVPAQTYTPLSDAQREDGCWPAAEHGAAPEHAIEVHALVCLALLADGNMSGSGHNREQVQRGIAWLLRQQDAHGRIGFAPHPAWALGHAIAVYAIAEDLRLARPSGSAAIRRVDAVAHGLTALAAHVGTVRPEPDAELQLWCELLTVSAWSLAHDLPADERDAASALRRGAIELAVRARERRAVPPTTPRAKAAAALLASLRNETVAVSAAWPDGDVVAEPLAAFYAGVAAWREPERWFEDVVPRLEPCVAALSAAQKTTGRVERPGDFHAARGWLATTAGTVMCACLHYRYCPFSALDHGR
jgi:hypothetical protein